jgi:hypothetical protein
MSYNYENVVKSIHEHRRRAYANALPDLDALQQSIEGFAILSRHCPMTPLLWMQYAHDTEGLMEGLMMAESAAEGGSEQHHQGEWRLQKMQSKKSALESSTGILELALAEFSGCAALQLYYLESLADYVYQCEGLRLFNALNGMVGMEVDDMQATRNKLSTAFQYAWKSVGRGSHVNEGAIVSEIYRLNGSFLLYSLSSAVEASKQNGIGANDDFDTILHQISTLFLEWSKTPMGEGSNDEIIQDMEYIWDEACSLVLSLRVGDEQQEKLKYDLAQQKETLWANIDGERKKTSSLTNILSSYENEIDVAMSNEGIDLPTHSFLAQPQDESNSKNDSDFLGKYLQSLRRMSSKWNKILLGDTNSFLLGLGGVETSRAFLKANSFLQSIYQGTMKKGKSVDDTERSSIEDHIAKYKNSVITSLFERAISECPTVESVWISYMNFLRAEWTLLQNNASEQRHREEELSSALQSTSHRAVRNCPYSCTLFEIRMTTLGLISASNLEPDDITVVIKEATELGFLTREALLHLRLVAILVVMRKLMSLVSLGTTTASNGIGKDYDEGEEMGILPAANRKNSTNGTIEYRPLNPTVMEEVQDLIEDIRDMYDEADSYLFKSHTTWSEGRVAFWKHRALAEAYTLCPIAMALEKAFNNDNEMDDDMLADKEAIQCFEKLVKAQKPSHPDSWREYIRYANASHIYLIGRASNSAQSKPDSTAAAISTLRRTRGLYSRAISCVKKASQTTTAPVENRQSWMGKGIDGTMFQRDYDAALFDLCREYLAFERSGGSEESFFHAQTLVRSKLASWDPAAATIASIPSIHEESHGKRKLEANGIASHPENLSSTITENHDDNDEEEHDMASKRVKVKTDLKQPKKTDGVHRVRIGKLDYPAHPYTIHVSNLSKDTQDMDLVDAFLHEFGAVVHAKILREKLTGKGGHHFHGKSKCAGLIQFEERSSVEDALRRDGEFEVGGRPIKIQRSHLPAVGQVPSGMHRVNPKGEGKVSKRNKLKKSNVNGMEFEVEGKGDSGQTTAGGDQCKAKYEVASASSPSSLSLGVLSLKPRGMKQRPKISLDTLNKK